MKEFLLINWNATNSGKEDVDFIFGPTLENLMNGASNRWGLRKGFTDVYEKVKDGSYSLYEVQRKDLKLEVEDREL